MGKQITPEEHHQAWMLKNIKRAYDDNALLLTAESITEKLRRGSITPSEMIERMETLFEIYKDKTKGRGEEC